MRNPWDWYISWYALNNGPKQRNPLFTIVSNNGQANLYTTLSNLINLGSESPLSQQHQRSLTKALPETLERNLGVGLTKDDIRDFSDNNIGYYSWMFKRMLGNYTSDQTCIGKFENLRHTEALLLIKFEDFRFTTPEFSDLYKAFIEVTQPLVDHIAEYYQDNGFVVRMIFAKLLAGGKIPEHSDTGYSLLNCHRVHIPIVSNEDNLFFVGDEQKIMQVGEFWEINNAGPHSVYNHSDEDRIHLIIDWMPNPEGKPLSEAVLPRDQNKTSAARHIDAAQLNTMVADAYQMHRAGRLKQAKSIYRTALDFEPKH